MTSKVERPEPWMGQIQVAVPKPPSEFECLDYAFCVQHGCIAESRSNRAALDQRTGDDLTEILRDCAKQCPAFAVAYKKAQQGPSRSLRTPPTLEQLLKEHSHLSDKRRKLKWGTRSTPRRLESLARKIRHLRGR